MKKKINAFLALFVTLIISFAVFSESSIAIDPDTLCAPCDSCEEFHKPYSGSYSYSPDSSGHALWAYHDCDGSQCFYEIYFKIRTCYCPDERKEIFIEKIEITSGCRTCFHDIMNDAVKQLIVRTPEIFDEPFLHGIGFWNVGIMYNKCWEFDNDTLIPCTLGSEECCKTRYWAELDSISKDYSITYVQKDSVSASSCPSIIGDTTCTDFCEDNNLTNGPIITSTSQELCNICPEGEWDDKSVSFNNEPTEPEECFFQKHFVKTIPAEPPDIPFNNRAHVYVSTKVCDSIKYIRIDRILLEIPADHSEHTIMLEAIQGALLRANGYFKDFLNNAHPGPHTYKIIISTCWRKVSGKWLIPCDDNECCERYYSVYIDTSINKNVPVHNKKETNYNWDYGIPGDSCQMPCNYKCDVLNDMSLNNGFLERKKVNDYDIENEKRVPIYNLQIIPNPADNSFKISFNSEIKGDFTIRLNDLNGNLMYQDIIYVNKSFEGFMDARNWSNGTYFINISHSGKNVISKKIIIEK